MPEPITRRDFLKRGTKYGGAAFFVAPAIRVDSLQSAGASPGNSSYGNSRSRSRSSSNEEEFERDRRRRRASR